MAFLRKLGHAGTSYGGAELADVRRWGATAQNLCASQERAQRLCGSGERQRRCGCLRAGGCTPPGDDRTKSVRFAEKSTTFVRFRRTIAVVRGPAGGAELADVRRRATTAQSLCGSRGTAQLLCGSGGQWWWFGSLQAAPCWPMFGVTRRPHKICALRRKKHNDWAVPANVSGGAWVDVPKSRVKG